jgi:hypothetical protein
MIPMATMLAVLPIIVRFPKSVPPKRIPHQRGVTSIPVFITSWIIGIKIATAIALFLKGDPSGIIKIPDGSLILLLG